MPRYVLVGGTNDGERRDLEPDRDYLQLPEKPPKTAPPPWAGGGRQQETIAIETYHRKRFYGGPAAEDVEVLALPGMTHDEIMRCLLRGYRRP